MELVAGIDVGGTFTDVLLYDTGTQGLRLAKVLSTPRQQADGLLDGLRQFGIPLRRLDAVVHGTTVATNAVLERRGSRAALVTTRGFDDVLEMRRRDRPTTYGLTGQYRPIVPRSLCFGVDERVDAQGRVLVPLSDDAVDRLADEPPCGQRKTPHHVQPWWGVTLRSLPSGTGRALAGRPVPARCRASVPATT